MNAGNYSDASLRHARYYIERAVQLSDVLKTADAGVVAREADRHWPQIRHAFGVLVRHAKQPGAIALLARALRDASDLVNLRCPSAVRVRWLEALRADLSAHSDPLFRASVLSTLGNYYRNLAQLRDSSSCLREAYVVARKERDTFELMRILAFQGFTAQQQRRFERALTLYRAAANIAKSESRAWWVGSAEIMSARCLRLLDRDASATLQRAEDAALSIGDPRLLANVHQARAMMAVDEEKPDVAVFELSKSITYSESIGDDWNLAASYTAIGRSLEDEGRLDHAIEAITRGLLAGERVGSVAGNRKRRLYIARLLRKLGRPREALEQLDKANSVPAEDWSEASRRDYLVERANTLLTLGNTRDARRALAQAIMSGRKSGSKAEFSLLCEHVIDHYSDVGDHPAALTWAIRTLIASMATENGEWIEEDLKRIDCLLEGFDETAVPRRTVSRLARVASDQKRDPSRRFRVTVNRLQTRVLR